MPIQLHPCQIPLEDNSIIWRYMSMDKYMSLLERSALFFCRADKFSDPFEGSIPKREAEYRIKEAEKNSHFYGIEFDKEKAQSNIDAMSNLHKRFKRGVIINCWHINNNESDAMWRLYLKDNEGVAIQSTALKMKQTMELTEEQIELSKIRYIDFEKDIWYNEKDYPHKRYNLIMPYMHKRMEFVYEQEYRLYHEIQEAINIQNENYWDTQENHIGNFIKIDLNCLIDNIYLPSTVDKKTTDKIVGHTKNLGYNFEFKVSKLQSPPYY